MADSNLLIQQLELDPADFPPLPLQPGFAQLVTDTLGNVATPTDGFDDVMGEAIAIVDALDTALGALALDLLSAFAEADTIDALPVSGTVIAFTASLAPSSAAVDDLGTLLGTATPPSPTGGGGGGGMTIGSATGPVLPCAARQGMGPGACSSYPCTAAGTFTNTGTQVRHISAITLVQTGTTWTAETDCTGTLSPGQTCRFTITAQAAPPAGAKAQLQFTHDGAGSPSVFCVDDGIGSSGIGGSGGGGPRLTLN